MAPFALKLFGAFELRHKGVLCTGFDSDKSRALLVFLALNQERPQRRETLAGLLWPNVPENRARASLSQALHNLRTRFAPPGDAPPLLCSDAKSVQLSAASPLWIDVQRFTSQVSGCPQHSPTPQPACGFCLEITENAVALYGNDLLVGFSIRDAPAFEEWLLHTRETLRRQCLAALQRLTSGWSERQNLTAALASARRWTYLEPTDETAQLHLIRLLAQSGQRTEALEQVERYCQLMQAELGLPPSAAAQQLAAAIRSAPSTLHAALVPPVATALPTFLQPESNAAAPESPFVGREAELARLESHLATALAGAGGVVWVTGEAGMGKSALVQRFARRAQAQHEPLVVITGHCNAHTGIGDPYLPFREALALLTGDVEGRLRAGALTATHAAQLWTLLPQTVAALLDIGPDLIGTFLPATPLADRVATLGAQDLLTRLQPLLTQPAPNVPGQEAVPHQRALFEQFTNVLQMLARRQPILLFLDDLQWADIGTISLLFHLGRTIAQDAILIFGAYRPSDVAAGRNGQRHPLEIVIHELQRQYGAIEVALEATDGRRFVEAIVDREPNRLPASFRDTLWAYTQGNALFTV